MAQASAGTGYPRYPFLRTVSNGRAKGSAAGPGPVSPGENIILSAVLEPVALSPSRRPSDLSACVALACYDLFSRYTREEDITIKWPNDLYWNDRKAGGILIENSFHGERWTIAIVGIGININQVVFPADCPQPRFAPPDYRPVL